MQEFYYRMIEDGTYCLTGYKGDETHVVIPDDKNITVLFDKVFAGHDEITSIHIPDIVTDMGEFLFDGCDRLKHIDLPSSLTYLWGHTFCRCGIEEIELPDKLESLPPFAFKDCRDLKRVICGKGMKKIHPWVFGGCESLEEVICGPEVTISPQAYEKKTSGIRGQ